MVFKETVYNGAISPSVSLEKSADNDIGLIAHELQLHLLTSSLEQSWHKEDL